MACWSCFISQELKGDRQAFAVTTTHILLNEFPIPRIPQPKIYQLHEIRHLKRFEKSIHIVLTYFMHCMYPIFLIHNFSEMKKFNLLIFFHVKMLCRVTDIILIKFIPT